MMQWFEAVEKVAPYLVKIETPRGHGTGFLCLYNGRRNLCGIATAYHVIRDADYWQEPIRLIHDGTPTPTFLTEADRVIFTSPANDSAVILFPARQLQLPEELIPLVPADRTAKVGVEVGWLGYPSVGPRKLCFFTGSISANDGDAYFIDGVAINGVSGGPVFHRRTDGIFILGTISAYYPNVRATGDTLPGLSFAQGVSHFHDTIDRVRSMDEAREAQKEQAEPLAPEGNSPTAPPKAVPKAPARPKKAPRRAPRRS